MQRINDPDFKFDINCYLKKSSYHGECEYTISIFIEFL